MMRPKLTEEQADQVYELLVATCAAPAVDKCQFVYGMTHGCSEYRICWKLGFGGKIYNDGDRLRVDGYLEDMTKPLKKLRKKVDTRLAEMVERWKLDGTWNPFEEDVG